MEIDFLLGSMAQLGASDLFISEGLCPALRVGGAVRPVDAPEIPAATIDAFLSAILTPAARERFDADGDLDVGYSLADGSRFRFNVYRQRGKRSLVARALPSGDLDIATLGLPVAVAKLAQLQRGLVLITGATGSGKSTTLAAIVHGINATRNVHVVTIEDPIEFVHSDIKARISQREIGTDTTSFAAGLRHVVRQSPDVILVGEMRDAETMSVAVSAALTGHLVFATLHTVDATQTLQRIMSYYPEHRRAQVAVDLALSLRAVVAQRLLPRADGSGRVVAAEVLIATPAVARLLREQRHEELVDLMKASDDPDLQTFDRSLLEILARGDIGYDTGLAYASNPDGFALAAQGMATGTETFRAQSADAATFGLDMRALLELAKERGASDLHLCVGRPPILRCKGELVPLEMEPLTTADMRLLLYSILTGRQRSIYELEREIDFAMSLADGQRFRVNAYYQRGKMTAALRAVPTLVPSAKELDLPDVLLQLVDRPHGLLLIVGPTGSGKTTTMSCLVSRINRARRCRIITIEDPIEYVHEERLATIDQREVYSDTKSFAGALKYILRQDPDVILVGEMRDLETVSATITAAETGHLVLATLHTNDAVSAIDRVIDVYPSHQQPQARSQLSGSLVGVVSQRLLRRQDGSGRVPACEILVATPAIRTLIRENKMHQAKTLIEAGRADGMQTMDHALEDLCKRGVISREEALRFASNPRLLVADE